LPPAQPPPPPVALSPARIAIIIANVPDTTELTVTTFISIYSLKMGSEKSLAAARPVTAADLSFDPDLVLLIDQHEREVTIRQALREEKRTLAYSVIYSGTIIMEGYGMALTPLLFSCTPFVNKFGTPKLDGQGREVSLSNSMARLSFQREVGLPTFKQSTHASDLLACLPREG
jgi:hypothetical protein